MNAWLLVLTYLFWDPSSLVCSVYNYVPLQVVVNVSWTCLPNSWQSLKRSLFSGCCFFPIPVLPRHQFAMQLPAPQNPPPLQNHDPGSLGYEHSPYDVCIFRPQGPRGCQPPPETTFPRARIQVTDRKVFFSSFIFFSQFQLRLWAEEAGRAFFCLVFKRTPIGYGELFPRDIPTNHCRK